MKRSLWVLGALIGLAGNTAAQEDRFRWRTDVNSALEEAKEDGRPLVVVFR